jgi:hypothetical protein
VICQEENTIYYKIFFRQKSRQSQKQGVLLFSPHQTNFLPSQHKKKAEISLGSDCLGSLQTCEAHYCDKDFAWLYLATSSLLLKSRQSLLPCLLGTFSHNLYLAIPVKAQILIHWNSLHY